MRLILVVAAVPCLLLFSGLGNAAELRVGATNYWNPYCYTIESDPSNPKGYSVDILKSIFAKTSTSLKFMVLPWKRCMWMLKNHQIDIVLDGSYSVERTRDFIFSNEVYHVDNVFFYSKKKYPDGPDIRNVKDVDKFKLGGGAGFNYDIYPFDVSSAEKRARDYQSLINMLKYDRFDLALGLKQIVLSGAKLGQLDLKGVGWIPMPDVPPVSFHFLAAKTPSGKQLISRINKGLEKALKDGVLEKLKRVYGIEEVGLYWDITPT